ncbi:hypothetical protein Tco_0888321, partial [Tanacetum coccineum]
VRTSESATIGTSTQKPYAIRDFPRGLYEVGEASSARDLSYVGGLVPWALRRDLDVTRARSRLTEAELGTCQAEIALPKSKDKIGEKERELLDHDLGDVERTLGNVLERVSVLESRENATLKKRLDETETKLAWVRMERDIAERSLHESRVWNKRFYLDMVRIRTVPMPPSNEEDTEGPRKKSKKSSSDGTEGPSEPRGPPSDSYLAQRHVENWITGLLAVRNISDPIVPLNRVSLTETPDSSRPKMFKGSMGHFIEAQSASSYFLSKSLTYFS